MSGKSIIPPRYVNVESPATYDRDLPDPLFRTFARICGLAWQFKGEYTPPLTAAELGALFGKSESSIWGHLSALRRRGLISWETLGDGRLIIRPRQLQSFGVANGAAAISSPGLGRDEQTDIGRQQQQTATSHSQELQKSGELQDFGELQKFGVVQDSGVLQNLGELQNSGELQRSGVEENLAALAEYGVDTSEPTARAVAGLSHVTPELIRAWGEHYRGRKGIHNLPGLLLHVLQTTKRPPGTPRRGRRRGQAQVDSGPRLPEELRKVLVELGIRGGTARAEIARIYAEDPARVQGWASYVLEHREEYGNPAGFLLTILRDGDPPPEPEPPEPAIPADLGGREEAESLWAEALAGMEGSIVSGLLDSLRETARPLGVDGRTLYVRKPTGLVTAGLEAMVARSLFAARREQWKVVFV